MGLLAFTYGSDSGDVPNGFSATDGAFYTDDAVILNGTYVRLVIFLSTITIVKLLISQY